MQICGASQPRLDVQGNGAVIGCDAKGADDLAQTASVAPATEGKAETDGNSLNFSIY